MKKEPLIARMPDGDVGKCEADGCENTPTGYTLKVRDQALMKAPGSFLVFYTTRVSMCPFHLLLIVNPSDLADADYAYRLAQAEADPDVDHDDIYEVARVRSKADRSRLWADAARTALLRDAEGYKRIHEEFRQEERKAAESELRADRDRVAELESDEGDVDGSDC